MPTTMRVLVWIGKHEVTSLVDNGSFHIFINSGTLQKVGLHDEAVEPFEVRVANGEKLRCSDMVHGMKMNVHGVRVLANLYV